MYYTGRKKFCYFYESRTLIPYAHLTYPSILHQQKCAVPSAHAASVQTFTSRGVCCITERSDDFAIVNGAGQSWRDKESMLNSCPEGQVSIFYTRLKRTCRTVMSMQYECLTLSLTLSGNSQELWKKNF